MKARRIASRRLADLAMRLAAGVAATAGIGALGWILATVIRRGAAALSPAFFTRLPAPPGVEGGGLANAMLGTLLLTALAAATAIPLGLAAGIYLVEFGRQSRFAAAVRLAANILMGVPSIITGVFVYTLLVATLGHFSGYAGAVALALIMLPVVVRTTEDMLLLVPGALREAGLALGAPRWRVVRDIVVRSARRGLLTGVILAVARVSGETAPLLFTCLNSPYWPERLGQPTANLTVTIFSYAMSPFGDWQAQAWGGAMVITAAVLALSLAVRALVRTKEAR
ncbi:MAG TPA: phosphate ABC transporter permease PstA [bacterium]